MGSRGLDEINKADLDALALIRARKRHDDGAHIMKRERPKYDLPWLANVCRKYSTKALADALGVSRDDTEREIHKACRKFWKHDPIQQREPEPCPCADCETVSRYHTDRLAALKESFAKSGERRKVANLARRQLRQVIGTFEELGDEEDAIIMAEQRLALMPEAAHPRMTAEMYWLSQVHAEYRPETLAKALRVEADVLRKKLESMHHYFKRQAENAIPCICGKKSGGMPIL